jgi:uncharacterized membrane protein YqjE
MTHHILTVILSILGIAGFFVLVAFLAEKKKRLVDAILFMPAVATFIYLFFNR